MRDKQMQGNFRIPQAYRNSQCELEERDRDCLRDREADGMVFYEFKAWMVAGE